MATSPSLSLPKHYSPDSEFQCLDYFFAIFEDRILAPWGLGPSAPIRKELPRLEASRSSRPHAGRTDMETIGVGGDIASILLILCAYAVFVGIWSSLYLILKQLAPLIHRFNRAKYYPLENEKRRYLRARAKEIALEKAKSSITAYGVSHGQMIRKRRSLNPAPMAEQVEAQWRITRENRSPIEKVRLGAMLAALEGTVDNALLRDDFGNIIGRNPGLRGWLKEHCPHLAPHYKTLMRYKALADKMQEVYGLDDPLPATLLLPEPERNTPKTEEDGDKIWISKYGINSYKYNGIYSIENSGGKFHVGVLEVTEEAARKIQERRKEALEMLAGPCERTMRHLEEALYKALGCVHLKRAPARRSRRKALWYPVKIVTVRMTAEDNRKYSPSYCPPRKPAYRAAYRPFAYRQIRPASSYQMRSSRRFIYTSKCFSCNIVRQSEF